jgi:hypothetical protein
MKIHSLEISKDFNEEVGMPMVNGMCEENAHAFITLHKGRIEFKVMLPYAKGSYISGSEPYGVKEYNEEFIVGQTILRLIRLNGVVSFDVVDDEEE